MKIGVWPVPVPVFGYVPVEPRCERCGESMVEHHCKLTCPNCGYTRDCSDP